MKHVKVFLFMFFFTQNILPIDHRIFIKKKDTASIKILKLNYLDSVLINNHKKDLENYIQNIENYVDLAIDLKKYESAILSVLKSYNKISFQFNQPKKAEQLLFKIEKYSDKIKDSYLLGGIYLKKAENFYSKNNFKEAIKNYTFSINNYTDKKKDLLHKADAYFFRGQTYANIGEFIKSINDYEIALKYYQKLKDIEYIFFTKTAISKIYTKMGFYDKAIKSLLKIIKDKTTKNYTTGLTSNYYNLALNYKKINNKVAYKKNLFKALKTKENRNDNDGYLPYYQVAIAQYYIENDSLDKAKKYLDLAKKECYLMPKNNYSLNFYNKTKSEFLFKIKKYDEALELGKKTIVKFKENGDLNSFKELNKLLYEIYLIQNKSNNALHHYSLYVKAKDSITNKSKVSALNFYKAILDAEKKEKKIVSQRKSINVLAKKNKKTKDLIIYLSIGSFLFFIIFYLQNKRIYLIKKKEIQEKYLQQLLQYQEIERKRISKDLHDSLGYSLLLIKNKISLKKDFQTEKLLNGAIEEIRNISKNLHPFQLNTIGISTAINNLIHEIDKNSDTYLFGEIKDIDNLLSKEKELNIYRIIQECLSNIVKHAKANSGKVKLIQLKNYINITIIDNGIGFNFEEKYNDNESLGLKTINERVKFLKGTIKIRSSKNTGTNINILLPLK